MKDFAANLSATARRLPKSRVFGFALDDVDNPGFSTVARTSLLVGLCQGSSEA